MVITQANMPGPGQYAAGGTGAQQGAAPARPVPASSPQEAVPAQNPAQVRHATEAINKALRSVSSNLQFSVDAEAKTTVVRVMDTQTKQVIRQMPSEETLEIAKALDKLQGLLIRQKA